METKKDIPEKGAIIQRDGLTYAIVPDIKGGICTPQTLRKIADVSEKYNIQVLKITSASRISLIGIKEEDLDNVWNDLGMKSGFPMGLCVRSIKFCPGTDYCRLGLQNSIKIGMEIDKKYLGMLLPNKFKIGISGCQNSCAESWLRDLGLIGTKQGWKIVFGGNSATKPKIAELVAENLNDDDALNLVDKIMTWYKNYPKKMRSSKILDEIGIEEIKKQITN